MDKPVQPSQKFIPNKYDVFKQLPAAGLTHKIDGESTAQCIKYETDTRNQRPPTPEKIQKYRRSFQHQPGVRFSSTGYVGLESGLPQHHRYGVTTSKGDRVGDCFDQVPATELQDFLNTQSESIYASNVKEPLGSTFSRGHVLPEVVTEEQFRFGTTTKTSESAKNLIYYNESIPDRRAYSLTNQPAPVPDSSVNIERDITRQIDRQYDWQAAGIDPANHRFGRVQAVENDGVADALRRDDETRIASKRLQQVRSVTHDRLGKSRELRGVLRNFGEDFVYGRNNVPDEWGAKKVIQGAYTMSEQLPDKDLGISTVKLSNLEWVPDNHKARAYGVPSIRNDLPAPHMKSVADSNNYGDEVAAKGLLYPSVFAFDGVTEDDFLQVRPKEEVREVFRRVGAEFTDEQFEELCLVAQNEFGGLSADSFRHAWNKAKFAQQRR